MGYFEMLAGTVGKLWVFIVAMLVLGLWMSHVEKKAGR
jgi:hypothetical protein